LIVILFALATILLACSNENGSGEADNEEAKYEITVGHGVATDTTFDKSMHKFKDLVEEESEGEIEVSVHPAAELGAEPDLFEGLMEGTIDVMITAPGSLGDFVPELSLFDLAFLVKDNDHQREITQG